MGMTLVQFREAINAFIEYQNFSNKLYEIGMAADDCLLWSIGFSYLKLIADVMGVDVGWIINWIDDLHMEVKDYTTDNRYGGYDFVVDGVEEMYGFLRDSEVAREECWL